MNQNLQKHVFAQNTCKNKPFLQVSISYTAQYATLNDLYSRIAPQGLCTRAHLKISQNRGLCTSGAMREGGYAPAITVIIDHNLYRVAYKISI